MKKLPLVFILFLGVILWSCGDDSEDYWTKYETWREENTSWFFEQIVAKDEAGNLLYTQVTPEWDKGSYVLMRFYNDTMETRNNEMPIYNSTVDVIYRGALYNGIGFDSSYLKTASYGDSISRIQISNTIKGWQIALPTMHIGDSCRVIIPSALGYGETYTSDLLLPYSTLVFDIKLVGIPGKEKPVL